MDWKNGRRKEKEGNLSSGKSKMNGGSAGSRHWPSVLDAVWLDVCVTFYILAGLRLADMEKES